MPPHKLLIGPITKGFTNSVTAFNIDNDAFPVLRNAYQWRKRIKRKRGTDLLGRLTKYFDSNNEAFNPGFSTTTTQTLSASGAGNLLTGFTGASLESTATLKPLTVVVTGVVSTIDYTDAGLGDGTLSPSGTINYTSGEIIIAAESSNTVTAVFSYYPTLPVLGLEPWVVDSSANPIELGFDTTYSYNVSLTQPSVIHNVSFYKNPAADAVVLPGYVPKSITPPGVKMTRLKWNLQDYQQIWSTNYQGALWATPGIQSPYTDGAGISMQFKLISTATAVGAPVTDVDFVTTTNHAFIEGDFVFINEVTSLTGMNFQTGYVLPAPAITATTFRARFPNATIAAGPDSTGIIQALTSSCLPGVNGYNSSTDCIRFYNGEPVDSSNVFKNDAGWVNFCPPLVTGPTNIFYIDDLAPGQYYLVGARMIVPYKDRILFLGPVVQQSTGSPKYLQDTVIYSQNGTPYYTASFAYATVLPPASVIPTTAFTPILLPKNQTGQPSSFWEDADGYGGFISAGYSRPITSVSPNEDALIVGFADRQVRLLYTGNDAVPFNFYVINSELGSDSTFSTITLDRGVLSTGGRGFILTSQTESTRIDLDIIDQVFQIKLTDSGSRRVCAQRDFINEWVYFTYPSNESACKFPSQTLQYNYREDTWALFNESYTTYGTVRLTSGETWANWTSKWPTYTNKWDSGQSTLLQPEVIGGNQQGFILIRAQGTREGNSLQIRNISSTTTIISGATQANPCVLTSTNPYFVGQSVTISEVEGMTQLNTNTYLITAVTATTITIDVDSTAFTAYSANGITSALNEIFSPDHCLNSGDYVVISGCLGTIASQVNGKVFKVQTITSAGFNIGLGPDGGTYLGGGLIKRAYVPFIQTKQFPVAWEDGRKTRLGDQRYLLTKTKNGKITLLIYLSQNAASPYNEGPIVPAAGSVNNALIYDTELDTGPEQYIQRSNNASLGVVGNGVDTAYNFNYYSLFSLNGDLVAGSLSIVVGTIATFSDNGDGTLTGTGTGTTGTVSYSSGVVTINFSVAPSSQVTLTNFQSFYPDIQNPTASMQSQIWHRVSTSLIGDTVQLGFTLNEAQMLDPTLVNQFSELEIHSISLDVFPSSDLA